mmetsp:Transcript_19885/g.32445  ORF Transcript_19885/g.32445 Transcript_19885/m.32445 type:complete len:227 (-) Transcript_19885:92-772(-)
MTDPVQRLNRREGIVSCAHLFTQTLDVAVDGPVIHIDLIIIGHVHQLVARFYETRPLGQRLQQQELGDGQGHIVALPTDRMAQRIHTQFAALHHFGLFGVAHFVGGDGILPTQQRADAFHQQTLTERFLNIIVSAHAQAQDFVDLVVLGGQEDHRHRGFLTQPLQQVHTVHARHLDVQNRHIRQPLVKGIQSRLPVIISFHLKAFGLEGHRNRRQDISVVVHQCNL